MSGFDVSQNDHGEVKVNRALLSCVVCAMVPNPVLPPAKRLQHIPATSLLAMAMVPNQQLLPTERLHHMPPKAAAVATATVLQADILQLAALFTGDSLLPQAKPD